MLLIDAFALLGFGLIIFGWSWLLWKMVRIGRRTIVLTRHHKLGPPPRGRMGYFPEAVVLSEAEMIERGITHLGHGDSLRPL